MLIWLGVGFLNRTGAEIGYQLDKKCKKIIFISEKLKNTEWEGQILEVSNTVGSLDILGRCTHWDQ